MHNIDKLQKKEKHTLKITKYTNTHSELKANITQKDLKHEYIELQKYRRETT